MARIFPFAGIRPLPELAASVSSRSPDRYSPEELQDTLNRNAHSFLQIIFPDHADGKPTKPGSMERLQKIKQRYLEFRGKGYFLQEDKPVYYVYQQQTAGWNYTGIIACSDVRDYEEGIIKIHEQTLTDREEKLREYLDICDYNSEPVLFCYPDHSGIQEILHSVLRTTPVYDFSTRGELHHKLWVIEKEEQVQQLHQYFSEIPAIYIADGHHRSASSEALAKARRLQHPGYSGAEPWNFFMGIYFPESSLRIFDYNRLVKDLNGLEVHALLEKISAAFNITACGKEETRPSGKHLFSMYVEGEWYTLHLKAGLVDESDPAGSLDAALLTRLILSPIFGIHDLKHDSRIGFVDGTQGPKALKDAVDSGKYKVAFGLYPVQMEELKRIADAGAIMPPKTTWVEPKLRNGLVIYPLS